MGGGSGEVGVAREAGLVGWMVWWWVEMDSFPAGECFGC